MAIQRRSIIALLFLFLSLHSTGSAHSPSQSPSQGPAAQSPHLTPKSPSPTSHVGWPGPSPSRSPGAPSSSPSIAESNHSPSPAQDEDQTDTADGNQKKDHSSGMSGGKKAGIVIGVLIGVGVVGLGGFVYMKRRQNVQRAQHGYVVRRGLI